MYERQSPTTACLLQIAPRQSSFHHPHGSPNFAKISHVFIFSLLHSPMSTISPFSSAAREVFESFVFANGQQRRVRPSNENHALIRKYLSGTRVSITQEDRRLKFKSLNQYCLIDGKLHTMARSGVEIDARCVPRDEEVFDIIINAHLGLVHAGRDKTFQEIERHTSGISEKEVSEVLRHCSTCAKKGSQRSKA